MFESESFAVTDCSFRPFNDWGLTRILRRVAGDAWSFLYHAHNVPVCFAVKLVCRGSLCCFGIHAGVKLPLF